MNAQFDGPGSKPSSEITSPNDPALAADFARATSGRPKGVRFTDGDDAPDPNREALFPSRYRDEPDGPPDQSELDNQQIHAYHSQVMAEQDEQLDQLGVSIGRQRDLSIQIGDELDSQAVLLDDVDDGVDRHQTQLDRAKGRLNTFARKARDNWTTTTIITLIVILVLLIVITK